MPNSKILAIEAYENNNNTLCGYIESSKLIDTVPLYNTLPYVDNVSMKISEDYRGGGYWAKKTNVTDECSSFKSTCIETILDRYQIEIVDSIKIDIEGAEQYVFESIESAFFLEKTRVVAIEIYDEFNIS